MNQRSVETVPRLPVVSVSLLGYGLKRHVQAATRCTKQAKLLMLTSASSSTVYSSDAKNATRHSATKSVTSIG